MDFSDNFLTTENVVKSYANLTALSGVSVNVPQGKIFGLLGPNGAGKTTLLRILNRIIAPDKGLVTFDGHPLCEADTRNIGYLPEERGLYRKMKVGEQAIYLAQLKGMSHSEARKQLTRWFERLDIMPWWNKKLEELSKGMQQKVQFVITLLHQPQLLILDEPFSGFDPVNTQQMKEEILSLRDQGRTVILSTHNMESVEQMCDNIALIDHSQVVLEGAVDQIRQQHRSDAYQVVISDGQLHGRPGLFEVFLQKQQRGSATYNIRNIGNLSNSQLCIQLAQQAELLSFNEMLPTMNDIFLQAVGCNCHRQDRKSENQG